MNRTVVLKRSFRGVGYSRGTRARISSFVDLDVPTSYQVPLAFLPSVSASSRPKDVREALHLPLDGWKGHSRLTKGLPQYIKIDESRIVTTSLKSRRNPVLSRQLQENAPQSSSGPPKPEKPKWEDEQYPDIGKTIDMVSNHLPFLFIQPLPKSILAPKIELRLFPSTYPSLPTLRLPKIIYRTIFRWVRWLAPLVLHRSLRSFGNPAGTKGIGLDITCLRVIKIENGRRIEARWRTASSPWSPSAPTNTAEAMPRTWSGWFYFDVNRQGLIVRHIIENVNNQRTVEGESNLKDILARTVSNGKRFADGLGSVRVDERGMQERGSVLRRLHVARIFPEPSPSNIFVSAQTYC